jgi:putative beta-lysine N-acetyltransferase
MPDAITRIGDTVVQHGRHNDRIYVMKLSVRDMPHIVHRLYDMAMANSYSKIFAKVPARALDQFIRAGYTIEAYVPGLFNGHEGGYFVARYFDTARVVDKKIGISDGMRALAGLITERRIAPPQIRALTLHIAGPEDAKGLAGLYGRVFSTYPFPINDADYIIKTMKENIRYFFVRVNGTIAAAASSEMDRESKNVELTDFVALPEYRGNGISAHLLRTMEENMIGEGMKVAYTIARATSYPINRVFSHAGYAYGGRLVNNTNICGSFESMNVWYKALDK